MRMKRVLSLALAFAMVFGMVNTSVFADENMNDGVYFTKSIVDLSGQPDRLKLEAFTTGVVTTASENVPTDIVLVVDQSGSMDNALGNSTVLAVMKDAVEEFVGEIAEMNGDSSNYRVAIVGFASQSGYNDNTEILTLGRQVEVQNESYAEVEGQLDTSKTYYVRSNYGNYYSSIYYRSNRNGWYYVNYNNYEVNINNVTVYERIVETGYEIELGIPYNTLTANNSGYDFADALIDCTDDEIAGDGVIGQAIDLLEGEGATRTDLGMELAYDILTEAADAPGYNREQVVVLLTDGVPTSFSDFDSGVANDAVEYAKELKDDGTHIFSMYLGSPDSQAANFLQAVSSNYPNATSITNLGTRAASSYYSAHSESAAIKNVFSQIVSSILSDSQLNESSIITDEISDYFRLPYVTGGEYDLDQIEVYTVDFLGGEDFSETGNWDDDEVPFDTATVELSEDGKTIQVTGFNFAYHCITTETKTSSTRAADYGRKLVIYIPIIPDESTDSFGGYLPTNEDAEIIHGQTTVDSADGCYADVTISYDLEPAERAYHVKGTFLSQPVDYIFSYADNMDGILNEMITGEPDDESNLRIPNGKNNAGVDMVYRLFDIGTDDRDPNAEDDTGDDKLVATLTVDYGEAVDVTDASQWTWYDENGDEIDLEDLEATITIPAQEYFAEKVYVLVCTLTNCDDNTDSLTVYDFLDVAAVRGELAHLVYGTIDEDGTVIVSDNYDAENPGDPDNNDPTIPDVNDQGTGSIVGGTYTEAVITNHDSDTMIFTTKEGYEIEFIRVLTSVNSPYDTWHTIYHVDDGVMDEDYEEIRKINDDLQETWEVYVENVTGGVAVEVSTRPLVFKLDTTADQGARVTDDTTFSYSATETLDVFFEARPGYYLDKVVVNGDTYTAEDANDPELAEEHGLHITGTATSWAKDGNGVWQKQTVITGGTIDLARVKNYDIKVYTKKQVHQVVYNYYVREYDSQTGLSYSDWENGAVNPTVNYVTYGEDLPLPAPTTGAETQITRGGEEDNYTLGEWYDIHNGEDFYGITDLTDVTMGTSDLDYHAYWAKNPSVKSALTIQKNVTGAHTEDETFTFRAIFHEDLVGNANITIPANSADSVSAQMDIELTDSQFDLFLAGNGAIYVYEVAGEETNYWQYDASIYAIRWVSELNTVIIWLNGEPVLDENGNIASVVNFTNEMIAESDLMISEKKLVSSGENVQVGDTLTWEITVVNTGYADGVLTADMIADEVLYEDANGQFVSFDPVQKAAITTALPLTVEAQDSVTLTATWIVPDAAEGKIIKNTAKLNGDDPEESEEVAVQQPDLKVEKRITKVGDTVIEYDAEGNRITAIPVVDPTDPATANIPLEWTMIVTNEGAGPGKFTLTDVLVKTDMEDLDHVENKTLAVAPAAQGEYYTVPANGTLTLTANYTVTAADAHHRLVNTVELKEHDDPTDPDDPHKKDESDPVDVAPYTVAYAYIGTLIPAGAEAQLPVSTNHEYQEEVKVADIPAVDGYTFYGWDTDDLAEADYVDEDTFVITGHVVFEGRWEKEHSELMVLEKVLTAVNGEAVTADTVLKVGDVLTWKIEVVNSGTGLGYVTESNLDDQVLYLDGTQWKAFATTAEVLPEGMTEWPDAPGVAVAARGGKANFMAAWTVPYEAEGKTIKNFAKVGDDDDGDDTPEVKVEAPNLKVEKVLTSPAAGKEVKPGTQVKWTITVTNEGKGPGKFTMTDVLTGSGVADAKVTIATDAVADQDGYYTIGAKTGENAPVLTFTATYVVAEADASHILINKVKITEHDGDEEEDESDPVEVAPYTVTYVDGVDNEVVFADQINAELKYGVDTPDFDTDVSTDGIQAGDPQREGYRFDGWAPQVADKVTGNATYVAQWTKVDPDLHVTDKKLVRVRDADHNLKKSGAPVVVGDYLIWEVTVTNSGNGDGVVTAADFEDIVYYKDGEGWVAFGTRATMLPDKSSVWPVGGLTVEAGKSIVVLAVWQVPASAQGKTIKNAAKVTGPDDPEESEEIQVAEPKVAIEKTVAKVGGKTITDPANIPTAQVGDTVQWTITVTNEGNAPGKFKLVDQLNGTTGTAVITGGHRTDVNGYYTIPANTTTGWTFTATYQVTEADKGTVLKNIVTADDGDPNKPDPTDEAEAVPVEDPEPAKLEVVKTIATIGGKAVEYNADGTVKTKAKVGEEIVWDITVTNHGEVSTSVKLTDTLTVVNKVTGETQIHTVLTDALVVAGEATEVLAGAFKYTVQKDDLTVQNVAVAESDEEDPSNPGTTPEITVEDPKLEATKTVDRTAAKVGETITYTIKVKNTGNVDLVNVTVKENFSGDLSKITVTAAPDGMQFSAADGTFTIPSLKEGVEATIVFTYVPEAVGTVTNTVVVTGKTENDTDPTDDPTDETDPTETEVTEQDKPGIDVVKTIQGKTTVEVGDKITYIIKVTNTGNVKLVNVVLDETGFSGNFGKITDITKSANDVTVDLDNEQFVIADMIPGEVVEITFSYKTTEEGTLENTVVVTGQPEGDTDPADDPTDEDEAPHVKVEEEDDPIIPVGPTPELDKGGDHLSYIIGYPDGTVQPTGTITRAEVATIFFRLLTDESRAYYWSQNNNFSDVAVTDWFNNAVSTMAAAGIVNGYPDGTFRPQEPVSRAEFAAIATRFTEEGRDGVSQKFFKQYFKDVNKDDWFAAAVELAYELGWAQGYEGSYRPEDDMTRAEVMTMVNRIMEREVREDDMLDDMIFWPDNLPEDWYYEAVQEATNSHTYERTNVKVPNLDFNYEVWKKLLENPDWAALERSWSDANSQN